MTSKACYNSTIKKGDEMKLKLKCVLLVILGLSVGSYAQSKWVTPSIQICISHGGTIEEGACASSWAQTNNICKALNGIVPQLHELKKVVLDCGGTIDVFDHTVNDSSYQECYKKEGFSDMLFYWTSSPRLEDATQAWRVGFHSGVEGHANKKENSYVRCMVKVEE